MRYHTMTVRDIVEKPCRELINDRQMRVIMSKDLCAQTPGAILVGDQCPRCRFFMFFIKYLVVCEFCRLQTEFAADSRNMLSVLKLAERGVVIEWTGFIAGTPENHPGPSGRAITGDAA